MRFVESSCARSKLSQEALGSILYLQWASVVCFRINSFASVFTPRARRNPVRPFPENFGRSRRKLGPQSKAEKNRASVESSASHLGRRHRREVSYAVCRLCRPPEHCQHLWPNRGTLQLAIVTNIIPKGQGVARILKVGRIRPPDWTDDYFTRRPKPCINESLSSDIWIRFLPLGSRYVYCSVRALS